MTDIESWEDYYELHERRDFKGLVAYCENEVKCHRNDLHAAERLADAYVLNGDYEKAIEFAGTIHREFPDISSFQHCILDSLVSLGKTEDDFDWSLRPTAIRLTADVLDQCFRFLQPLRKPRSVDELRYELQRRAYLTFSDNELFDYLRRDSRFVIVGDTNDTAKVTVSRATRHRTSG